MRGRSLADISTKLGTIVRVGSVWLTDNRSDNLAVWHRVAADEKADSVVQLAPEGMDRIIEIGCGSGAILEALDRRGFGGQYWGCEPTRSLFDEIPTDRIRKLVEAVPLTFAQAFPGETYDLGIMAHVGEHLRTPAVVIAEALERCRYLIVELPIEDNVLGKTRAKVKEAIGHDRLDNEAGHVQFFSRRTARALIHHSGGKVLAERPYFPMAPFARSADHAYQRAVVKVAEVSPLLAQRYYEHFAMLAQAITFENWTGHYIPPE